MNNEFAIQIENLTKVFDNREVIKKLNLMIKVESFYEENRMDMLLCLWK